MRLAWPSILGGVLTGAQAGGGVPNYERGLGREAALRVCKRRFLTCRVWDSVGHQWPAVSRASVDKVELGELLGDTGVAEPRVRVTVSGQWVRRGEPGWGSGLPSELAVLAWPQASNTVAWVLPLVQLPSMQCRRRGDSQSAPSTRGSRPQRVWTWRGEAARET